MSNKELLLNEIDQLPESMLTQVLDYVNFLKSKLGKQKSETTLLTESSLKKDWLRPEEDEAWKNL